MDTFEIIDQPHISVSYNDDNDNNNNNNDDDDDSDSRSSDEENSVVSSASARKKSRDLESYNSIKTTSKFYSDDN
jgi:hypothetical protein